MSTIVLWVSDINKSSAFYADLFNSTAPYITEEFASIAGNGNEVLIHLLPEEFRSSPSIGEENPIKPVFSVPSISAARAAASRHGCSFKENIMQHGTRSYLDGLDPDGHVIQIMSETN